LPGFLRWLPQVTIEGDVETPPDGSGETAAEVPVAAHSPS
jgi:hypothetical protein